MKFKKADIQLILISLAIGAIAAIIAKLFNLSTIVPLSAVLLTTIFLRTVNKFTQKIYRINMQFTFVKYEHVLVLRLVGINDQKIDIVWITVRKFGCAIDISKITQFLAEHKIFVDDNGCLHINDMLLESNSIMNAFRMQSQAAEAILPIIYQSMGNSPISTSLTSTDKKRSARKILFWR